MSEQDPDVIRGIERVTGESFDPATGQWTREQQDETPAVVVQAGLASASAAVPDTEADPEDEG